MKKIILILIAAIALKPAFSQLKNTKWEGAIKGDNSQNAMLDFKKDTLIVYGIPDNKVIETMIYHIIGKTFTIKKIEGQSDCDNTHPGKYGFEITGNKISIKLIDDACADRSSALDMTKWTKRKSSKIKK